VARVALVEDGFDLFGFAQLPSGWRMEKLGALASSVTGGGTPSTKVPEYWDGDIPWTTSAVIDEKDIVLSRYQRRITERGLRESSTQLIPTGSVLIGTRVGVGKTAVTSCAIAISQDLTALVPKPGVCAEFVALVLKSLPVVRWFEENKRGTTIKGVSRNDVMRLMVPMPTNGEQRAIAGVLRTVQEAIGACERVIAATRQLKHSLLAHLFTYGPVPVEQAEQVQLQETASGAFPAEWCQVPIGQCASVQTGVAKGRKLNGDEVISVPYLRVANVQSGRLDLSEMKSIELRKRELDRYLLQAGDIVLTEGGDFDKLGRGFIWRGEISPCVHQNHIFAVRADRSRLLPEFLAFFVQSDHARSYFLGVAHKTTNLACINKTKLEGLPVLLPSLAIQRQITSQLSTVDAKLAAEESRRDALASLFASLLDNLMTGRVRLPEFARGT